MSPLAPIVLDPLYSDHAGEMFSGLADPVGYRFLPDEPPETVEILKARYIQQAIGRSADGSEIWLNWVVRQRQNGNAAGYTQATIRAGSALLGYHIFPIYWHRGLGGLAVRLTMEVLFERMDVQDVRALVDTRNQPSIALLRRLGFDMIQTVIAADHFKGASSDEHEFVMSVEKWHMRRS